MPQQPSFFQKDPTPRKPRQPSQNEIDYRLWLRVFAEVVERERVAAGPTAIAEERRHLKVLRNRIPDDKRFEAFLREYAALDDKWLDDRDYPLRNALSQATYVRVVKSLDATVVRPAVVDDPDAARARLEKDLAVIAERDRKRREQQAVKDREREEVKRLAQERHLAAKRARLEGR